MKPNAWLLLGAVVYGGFAAIQCVCARGQAGIHSSGLPEIGNLILICDGRLPALHQRHSHIVHYRKSRLVNAGMTAPASPYFSRSTELTSDDGNQAGDSRSNDQKMGFACLQPCLRAEWRLIQPDTLGFDSFINSKTRPPP